jgi:hypothetical protein
MKRFRADSELVPTSALLAAQGVSGVKDEEAVTLASDGHRYIMRVVRDAGSGELWLYLLSNEPGATAGVVVSPFGGSEAYVTDERGRINLGARAWPGEGEWTAEVRQPLGRFKMFPSKVQEGADSAVVLTSERGDKIRVTLSGSEHGRRLSVVLLDAPGLIGRGPLRVGVRGVGGGSGSLKVEYLVGEGVAAVDVASGSGAEGAAPEFEIYLFA